MIEQSLRERERRNLKLDLRLCFRCLAGAATLLLLCPAATVHAAEPDSTSTPLKLVQEMVRQEQLPHPDRYEYWNEERSERTGGHLWREHILETGRGKLAILEQVDGQPLSPDRAASERRRLDAIVRDPASFDRFEAAQQNDELRARQMLDSLPRCFILENVTLNNGVWRIEFRPNPAYSPTSMAEKVLHGMSGWFSIDDKQKRLIHLEGHLASNVSIGFGLINILAGSNFSSDRAEADGNWRMTRVHTDIRGHALLFKTITHNTNVHRLDFHYLDASLSIPEAVSILESGSHAADAQVATVNRDHASR
ncbi:hypothetical protein SAMN05421819_4436 [Bryocella elongata]|uniref:Outer membrane lipoprotein-sorting protein n=1 Tax=Bryocella elongata TaxID=863522 RepID=A0A1H6CC02_9BACT|nr:hypothetical protein [Bryocella elongata]SEG70428.1 hypothetical protein SAMN05421819_4436 [Bryocella elongata]